MTKSLIGINVDLFHILNNIILEPKTNFYFFIVAHLFEEQIMLEQERVDAIYSLARNVVLGNILKHFLLEADSIFFFVNFLYGFHTVKNNYVCRRSV